VTNVTDSNQQLHQFSVKVQREDLIADSEAQSYARIRRLLAEPLGSVLQGYGEAAWANNATFGYEELADGFERLRSLWQTFGIREISGIDVVPKLYESSRRTRRPT
jgi:hypothetical protein